MHSPYSTWKNNRKSGCVTEFQRDISTLDLSTIHILYFTGHGFFLCCLATTVPPVSSLKFFGCYKAEISKLSLIVSF